MRRDDAVERQDKHDGDEDAEAIEPSYHHKSPQIFLRVHIQAPIVRGETGWRMIHPKNTLLMKVSQEMKSQTNEF
jgi:hypothetical protein